MWKITAIVLIALGLLSVVIYSTEGAVETEANGLAVPSLNPELDKLNTQNVKLRLQLAKERKGNAQTQGKLRREIRRLRRVARDVIYPTPAGNKRLAQAYFGNEYQCAAEIINGETAGTWDHTIWNYEGSGAYGLGQALPRSKMLAYGADAYTNPLTQLIWFEAYAEGRYGSVCGAAAHWTPTGSW